MLQNKKLWLLVLIVFVSSVYFLFSPSPTQHFDNSSKLTVSPHVIIDERQLTLNQIKKKQQLPLDKQADFVSDINLQNAMNSIRLSEESELKKLEESESVFEEFDNEAEKIIENLQEGKKQ